MADLTIVATGSLPVNTSRRLSLTTGLVVLVLHALVVALIAGNQPTGLGPAHHLGNGHADGLAGHGLLPDRRVAVSPTSTTSRCATGPSSTTSLPASPPLT